MNIKLSTDGSAGPYCMVPSNLVKRFEKHLRNWRMSAAIDREGLSGHDVFNFAKAQGIERLRMMVLSFN